MVFKPKILLSCRYLQIMNLARIQLMFQDHGYGICQDGLYTLEPLYQQFSKVREYLYTSIYYIAIPI